MEQTAFLPAVAQFTLMFERWGCKLEHWMSSLEKCTTSQKTAGGDMDLKVAGASPKWWSRLFKMSSVNRFQCLKI